MHDEARDGFALGATLGPSSPMKDMQAIKPLSHMNVLNRPGIQKLGLGKPAARELDQTADVERDVPGPGKRHQASRELRQGLFGRWQSKPVRIEQGIVMSGQIDMSPGGFDSLAHQPSVDARSICLHDFVLAGIEAGQLVETPPSFGVIQLVRERRQLSSSSKGVLSFGKSFSPECQFAFQPPHTRKARE